MGKTPEYTKQLSALITEQQMNEIKTLEERPAGGRRSRGDVVRDALTRALPAMLAEHEREKRRLARAGAKVAAGT